MANLIQAVNSQISLPFSYLSASPEETTKLGEIVASILTKGSIVALTGPLGSGKTCLVKGIAAGLGIKDEITSPTYTIISTYEGFIKKDCPVLVYHIDAFRLRGNDDFSAIGGEEIVFDNGISLIEWSDLIPSFISSDSFRINIKMEKDDKRQIEIFKSEFPVPGEDIK